MYQYIDNNNNQGIIPEKTELYNISKLAYEQIFKDISANYILSIPTSANYLLDFFKDLNKQINVYKPLSKATFLQEIELILENNTVVLVDDIICHGETIKAIINSNININNIKAIIIFFNIISKKICLFDIERQKFTLTAENRLYYLYFIEEKYMLKIPTFIFATYSHILMKSDVEKYGAAFKYFINGEELCQQRILKYI